MDASLLYSIPTIDLDNDSGTDVSIPLQHSSTPLNSPKHSCGSHNEEQSN